MVILYNPPSTAQKKPVLPMSLLALGALLEDEWDYCIIDGDLDPDPVGAIERAIREMDVAILGVTVMPGPQLRHAVVHSRCLKAMHPGLTIVWGGYFPTQHPDVCLRADYVDYVVRGYGETAFKGLVGALRRGADPTVLPGVAYRDRESGTIRSNELAPMPHPDQLPGFPYHRLDVPRYIRRTFMGERTLPHHSSYGCPFSCNFCAVVNMAHGRWKPQSAERAAATVRYLVRRWGIDAVEFYDNNFFVGEARTAEFAERIEDLGIGWWAEARIDTLSRYSARTWQVMRDSGLRMVFMGAESGSDETLGRMDKGGTSSTETTLTVVEKMGHYGIVPELSFVLGNPPDAETDARQTLAFIRTVKRVNPLTEIIMYLYAPVPLQGQLYDLARAGGFRYPDTLDDWVTAEWQEFSQRRSRRSPWMEGRLYHQVQDFERVINAYYPTCTNPNLHGLWRWALKALSAWRYHLRFYRYPVELRVLNKFLAYQRPETSGF